MRVLVTGAAGFIGFHVARRLLARGDAVTGFDNLNAYYDPGLKAARLAELDGRRKPGGDWRFRRADLADAAAVAAAFDEADRNGGPFDRVIHLAAQAGVRYSLENPEAYVEIEPRGLHPRARGLPARREPRTSSSPRPRASTAPTPRCPSREAQEVGHPLQFYAATKRANELMAHAYAHLFALPCTGLRFFTVYGPWGRPDMAPMLFADAILAGRPIRLYSEGRHSRDFTYVDDIAEGVLRAADVVATPDPGWDPAAPDPGTSAAPFRIYNIGNGAPVELLDFIAALERALGRAAIREPLPPQPGDVPDTWADCGRLAAATGWRPSTPVEAGVERFVAWYRDFYGR